jgi:hypothetical protein
MTYMKEGDIWHILRSTHPARAYCGKTWRLDDEETDDEPDRSKICRACRLEAIKAGLKIK